MKERSRQQRQCDEAEGEKQAEGQEEDGPPDCLPVLDLVLSQANPKGDAELYIRCFHQVRPSPTGACTCVGGVRVGKRREACGGCRSNGIKALLLEDGQSLSAALA